MIYFNSHIFKGTKVHADFVKKFYLRIFSAAFIFLFVQLLLNPLFPQTPPDNRNENTEPKELQEKKEKTKEEILQEKRLKSQDEYEYFIQWEEVKGNNGYAVQIKDLNELLIVDTTVLTNSYEFIVPLGKYKIRIAALNKFGKPSEWTKWDQFTVDRETAKPKRNIWKSTKKYIPCATFFSAGHTIAGSGCVAWFAGLGGLFYVEKRAGDRLAQKELNDPAILAGLSMYQPSILSVKMYMDKKRDRELYEKHQRNQKVIGLVAALSYTAYVLYSHGVIDVFNSSAYQMDIRDKMEDILVTQNSTSYLFEYRYNIPF